MSMSNPLIDLLTKSIFVEDVEHLYILRKSRKMECQFYLSDPFVTPKGGGVDPSQES